GILLAVDTELYFDPGGGEPIRTLARTHCVSHFRIFSLKRSIASSCHTAGAALLSAFWSIVGSGGFLVFLIIYNLTCVSQRP
ncbi:hypothetical protein EI555_019189, partial [Monodon monoceros]